MQDIPPVAIDLRVIERDMAIENLQQVTMVLRTIYNALSSVEDWGDVSTVLDGLTLDLAGDLLAKCEHQYPITNLAGRYSHEGEGK